MGVVLPRIFKDDAPDPNALNEMRSKTLSMDETVPCTGWGRVKLRPAPSDVVETSVITQQEPFRFYLYNV